MNKRYFRVLLCVSFFLALVAGGFDYIQSNPITLQVIDYASDLEADIDDTHLALLGFIGIFIFSIALISFIGLFLFKNWARHLYLISFLTIMPIYPFMGVTVFSGIGLLLNDLSVASSGLILALIYFTPVSRFYKECKHNQ